VFLEQSIIAAATVVTELLLILTKKPSSEKIQNMTKEMLVHKEKFIFVNLL